MKVMTLSQCCTSILNHTNNYGAANKKTTISINTSKNNIVSPQKDFDKSLQKVYCLSSLGFLTCLAGFYAITAYICSQSKQAAPKVLKMLA